MDSKGDRYIARSRASEDFPRGQLIDDRAAAVVYVVDLDLH
jgi:hypothetical protein